MNEDLRWMLVSIKNLLQARDYCGAFVFCLISIEALAHQRLPQLSPGERFRRFLHEARQPYLGADLLLPDAEKCQEGSKLELPTLDNFEEDIERWQDTILVALEDLKKHMISIEQVLWKYCRCPMVHEGARLAVDGDTVVTLDWSIPPSSFSVKVDQQAKNVIIIGAPFLLNMLYQIVVTHLSEDTAIRQPV